MPARSFEDVDIWKKAHQFVLDVYRLAESFPKHELFCLTSQLRRAAISIPANFAEGFRKASKRDKVRFYNIALDHWKSAAIIFVCRGTLAMARLISCDRTLRRSARC